MDEKASAGACSPRAAEEQPTSGIQASSYSQFNDSGLSPPSTPAVGASETVPATKSPSGSALMEPEFNGDNQSTETTTMRRRLRPKSEVSSVVESDLIASAMYPLTDEERRNWPGWVELESDPALFNFILREYGVKDVKVQEVLGLESALLDMLPQPVYGLIFLYKYRDEEEATQESSTCPQHVWFANQTINNACATVALLNIVMNVSEIDLGETLRAFKAETRNLKPPYRGKKLGSNEFIRTIHNSFARRLDILNADLVLFRDMENWGKAKKYRKKRVVKRKKDDENEPGFHFIAYVPINGEVWKLDGLRRQPDNLGSYQQEDWMAVAVPHINEQMFKYQQDGVQFNLLSLCRSPLRCCPEKLAESLHAIRMLKNVLEAVQPNWQQFTEVHDATIVTGADETFGISQDLIDTCMPPQELTERIENSKSDATAAINLYQELVRDQLALQRYYWDELALIGQEDEQANRRKQDYTSLIYNTIKALSEKGMLKEIVDEVNEDGSGRK